MLVPSHSSCVAPSGGEYPVSSPHGLVTCFLLSFFSKIRRQVWIHIERAAILMCRESDRVLKLAAEMVEYLEIKSLFVC